MTRPRTDAVVSIAVAGPSVPRASARCRPAPRGVRTMAAGGCSNHGFKHSTGIGEAVAGLVQTNEPTFPLGFTAPDRFE
ncbi:N-methyltryptophan oxidase [Streptomyces sp. YIM 130001]|nr:N-methyltryptophan oxidase [Streptomyces sp. YIM 130001]